MAVLGGDVGELALELELLEAVVVELLAHREHLLLHARLLALQRRRRDAELLVLLEQVVDVAARLRLDLADVRFHLATRFGVAHFVPLHSPR